MNTQLWNAILQFDFDDPISEYGFSTRLADENYWTKDFTSKAILEYKKFMYLAATAESMVSPSEIIDIVWHQHLIFTQSYDAFCNLTGKNIQHIPSTHSRADGEKFREAKVRTSKLYNDVFGKQPADIWLNDFMLDSLLLTPAKLNVKILAAIMVLIAAILTVPLYHLLKPVYVQINNPYFLYGFVVLAAITLIGLEFYNRKYLHRITSNWSADAFVYHLHPSELVYLQKLNLQHVIHGKVNQLLLENKISITSNDTLQLNSYLRKSSTSEELVIKNFLHDASTAFYPELLRYLMQSKVFSNTAKTMDSFKKHFTNSTVFGKLFKINMGAVLLLFLILLIRLMTGLVRDKPIGYVCFAILILVFVGFAFILRLINLIGTHTLPRIYKKEILPEKENTDTWDWEYFLFGHSVFISAFVPLVGYVDRNNSDSSGSSGGSSCGSSCGGGCGGCGGD